MAVVGWVAAGRGQSVVGGEGSLIRWMLKLGVVMVVVVGL